MALVDGLLTLLSNPNHQNHDQISK